MNGTVINQATSIPAKIIKVLSRANRAVWSLALAFDLQWGHFIPQGWGAVHRCHNVNGSPHVGQGVVSLIIPPQCSESFQESDLRSAAPGFGTTGRGTTGLLGRESAPPHIGHLGGHYGHG